MPLVGPRSASTNRHRATALMRWYEVAGVADEYSVEQATKAVEKLEKKGYRPGYVRQIVNTIRTVAKMPEGHTVPVAEGDVRKTTLPDGEIEKMILTMKGSSGSQPTAYLFLATVYGLRPEEMTRFQPGDIDLANKRIMIRTAKGGVQRRQPIPDVGVRLLSGINIGVVSTSTVHAYFLMCKATAGLPHRHGEGWHAIRRLVVTCLIKEGNPRVLVEHYMRWRKRSTIDEYIVQDENMELDKQIQEKHPFLRMWEAR